MQICREKTYRLIVHSRQAQCSIIAQLMKGLAYFTGRSESDNLKPELPGWYHK